MLRRWDKARIPPRTLKVHQARPTHIQLLQYLIIRLSLKIHPEKLRHPLAHREEWRRIGATEVVRLSLGSVLLALVDLDELLEVPVDVGSGKAGDLFVGRLDELVADLEKGWDAA